MPKSTAGTYLITDGGSQAWAIVTQRGVILVDVPEPLARVLIPSRVTNTGRTSSYR